jgi:hypothetical protein
MKNYTSIFSKNPENYILILKVNMCRIAIIEIKKKNTNFLEINVHLTLYGP